MAIYAAKIAFHNFEWRFITLVIFTTPQALGVPTFMKNYGKSVVLKFGQFVPSNRVNAPQFVLFGDDSNDITTMLKWLISVGYENTGKYILVCTSEYHNECDEHEVTAVCVHLRIVNVILFKGSTLSTEPQAYSFSPVLSDKCFNSEPELLDIHWGCAQNACFIGNYPEKLNNLHRCPITVSTFNQYPFMYLHNDSRPTGSDGELLQLVINIINATLQIMVPSEENWGHYENNNWTGSMGDVFNGKADVSMCSAPLTYNKYGNFQISFTYNSMDMVWVAGVPALKPSWEKLLYPLKIYIRIAILLMFIAIVFVNLYLKTSCWSKIRKTLNIAPPKSNLLFYSYVLFLGLPITKMPSKVTLLWIVLCWIWFSFVIRIIYQAALVGFLKQQLYESDFANFQEVLESRRPFGGSLSLREYYSEDGIVYGKWKNVHSNEVYPILDQMTDGTSDFVLAVNRETVLEYLIFYNGTRSLQIIPEKIVNSPTVMYLRKYSPLTMPLSRILVIAMEGGFTERLYARFVSQSKSLLQRIQTTAPDPLRLKHFTGSIVTLIAGWMISILFFVIEYASDKIYIR